MSSLESTAWMNLLHQTPGHVGPDVNVVVRICIGHRTNIPSEILRTEVVLKQLLKGQVVLPLDTGSVLSHINLGTSVPVAEPLEQLAEPKRVRTQPHRLSLWANAVAVLVLVEDLEVASKVVGVGLASLGLDVVGTVVVHAVEVVATLDQGTIFVRPLGKPVSQLLDHAVWVFAEVNGVREPGDGELDLTVTSLDVCGVLAIPGLSPVTYTSMLVSSFPVILLIRPTVEGDANLSTMSWLELLSEDLHSSTVSNEEGVSHNPALPAAITLGALSPIRSTTRRKETGVVAQDRAAPWLVEGDPMLDLRGQSLEDDARVVRIVRDEFLLIQHAAISLVELVGQIPVEEGDHGGDSCGEQIFHELDVVLEAFLVDGVVTAAKGDDTRPVGKLHMVRIEQ